MSSLTFTRIPIVSFVENKNIDTSRLPPNVKVSQGPTTLCMFRWNQVTNEYMLTSMSGGAMLDSETLRTIADAMEHETEAVKRWLC